MVAASAELPTEATGVEDGPAPPEIVRFLSRGVPGDYYQALRSAALVRLRLLGTLHARSEFSGFEGVLPSDSATRRLEAQQTLAWDQLQWVVSEMRRLDRAGQSPN
jgi:hypothetical protein